MIIRKVTLSQFSTKDGILPTEYIYCIELPDRISNISDMMEWAESFRSFRSHRSCVGVLY